MSFYKKFKNKYKKDKELKVEISMKVLWIDDDMVEGTFGRALKKTLEVLPIPRGVIFDYSTQDDALTKFETDTYGMVILDNDSYRGEAKGPDTYYALREKAPDIPIVYTSMEEPDLSGDFEFCRTPDIPKKLVELLIKYLEVEQDATRTDK
ncbi:hypothetical protein KY330_04000 [Candidatus Woesearchaeota archaeon]|nr:hypothetical protein [Candidatus Woesearchaeota archaeon]